MPIYEEKLLCPFAIRFTQEHIRNVFRDAREVEKTIEQMTLKEGFGDFELICVAPFPNIEIIRWYQNDSDGLEPDADHWFTLDNRRLYCLQRIAATVWPKRVAAVVEVLYAVPDSVRRKDSSATAGRTVGIGHNTRSLQDRWDWREAVGSARCKVGHALQDDPDRSPWGCDACGRVMPTRKRFRCLPCDFDFCEDCRNECPKEPAFRADSDPAELAASRQIALDDKKTVFQELANAPAAPGLLAASMKGQLPDERPSDASGSEKSSPSPRTGEEEAESLQSPGGGSAGSGSTAASGAAPAFAPQPRSKEAELAWPDLSGAWRGSRKEIYRISFSSDVLGSCVRTDTDGHSRNFTLKYDLATHTLWWGVRWSHFVDLASLAARPSSLPWYSGEDMAKEKPAFYWNKVQEENSRPPHVRQVHGGKSSAAADKKGSATAEEKPTPKAKKAARAPKVGAC